MHKISPKRFAQLTGIPLMEVNEKAERGETVKNIDLSEYAQVDSDYGMLEEVHVPDRLMPNLRAGPVSGSTSADAYEAGRMAERKSRTNPESSEMAETASEAREAGKFQMLKKDKENETEDSAPSRGLSLIEVAYSLLTPWAFVKHGNDRSSGRDLSNPI